MRDEILDNDCQSVVSGIMALALEGSVSLSCWPQSCNMADHLGPRRLGIVHNAGTVVSGLLSSEALVSSDCFLYKQVDPSHSP